MDRDEHLSRQLDRITTFRTETNRSVWIIVSIFMAATAVLVTEVIGRRSDLERAVLCLVGTFAGVFWAAFLARAIGHLDFDEQVMKRLEDELNIEPKFSVLRDRNPEAHQAFAAAHFPWPIRPIMMTVAAGVGLFWFLAFAWFCSRLGGP
jgi:hypothetical protein